MKYYTRTKYACFIASFSTAFTGNFPPLLFLTFRDLYGLSYSLLGLLIVINFGTQLLFDLIFSFLSDKLPTKFCLRMMPTVMAVGLAVLGLTPYLFSKHIYFGLTIATILFSAGSGLAEVLTSPTIAAIPSKNPERLMARLHTCYAVGVVVAVLLTTLYFSIFESTTWMYLAFIYTLLPLSSALLFIGADIPDLETEKQSEAGTGIFKNPVLWLCVACIFLGGASECTMSQWCSAYLEQAFSIPKAIGDVFGVALFGAMLGLGRFLYTCFGKNVERFLVLGSVGAFVCYITAVFAPVPILGLIGCALTGFCVSMLWPGSLIATSELIPTGGVAMYAIMAAGGDLGASVCPQLVGIIADVVVSSPLVSGNISPDSIAMKAGFSIAALFPLAGIFCFGAVRKKIIRLHEKKRS